MRETAWTQIYWASTLYINLFNLLSLLISLALLGFSMFLLITHPSVASGCFFALIVLAFFTSSVMTWLRECLPLDIAKPIWFFQLLAITVICWTLFGFHLGEAPTRFEQWIIENDIDSIKRSNMAITLLHHDFVFKGLLFLLCLSQTVAILSFIFLFLAPQHTIPNRDSEFAWQRDDRIEAAHALQKQHGRSGWLRGKSYRSIYAPIVKNHSDLELAEKKKSDQNTNDGQKKQKQRVKKEIELQRKLDLMYDVP